MNAKMREREKLDKVLQRFMTKVHLIGFFQGLNEFLDNGHFTFEFF
jgi:hypothetical protein